MTALTKMMFAAVRNHVEQSREWIDMATGSFDAEEVQILIKKMATEVPLWDKANPVVRIARVRVEEIIEIPADHQIVPETDDKFYSIHERLRLFRGDNKDPVLSLLQPGIDARELDWCTECLGLNDPIIHGPDCSHNILKSPQAAVAAIYTTTTGYSLDISQGDLECLDINLDATAKRLGTAHAEYDRNDGPFCAICGNVVVPANDDSIDPQFHPEWWTQE